MNNDIRVKIASLSVVEVIQITKEHKQYETDGFIGDCLLRDIAEAWCEEINSHSVAIWMNLVAFEAYRVLAEKYIATLKEVDQ